MITSIENFENWIYSVDDRYQLRKTEDGKHYVDPIVEFGWIAWKASKNEILCPECDSFNFSSCSVDDDCGTECECRECSNIWRI